jgi:hypothetical protein
MLYRAKSDRDLGVKGCKVVGNGDIFGYKLVKAYFVDNSGFCSNDEVAITFYRFLEQVKSGYYYGIQEVGQFQVYIGEYKKVNRAEIYVNEGIIKSKLISKSCRVTNYKNGDFSVTLYTTEILRKKANKIILNAENWRTVTTKRRINEFLPQGIFLYQKDRKWYIDNRGVKLEFFDGIELTA